MCKIRMKILILALMAWTLLTVCPFYISSHKKPAKIPQLYKKSILYSVTGETALNLHKHFNHKCNQS